MTAPARRYACANSLCPLREPVAADAPPTCYTCWQAMTAEPTAALRPVLSPARWWRDDAARYDDRPLIGVCRDWTQPKVYLEWAYDLARPSPEPEQCFTRLAELQAEMWRSMILPADLLDASSVGYSTGAGAALAEYRDHVAEHRKRFGGH